MLRTYELLREPGHGTGSTIFVFGNGFVGNMSSLCDNGASSSACFVIPQNAMWSGFKIYGGETLTDHHHSWASRFLARLGEQTGTGFIRA